MAARIERVVTSGTFSIDGEDFAVDNNIWLVGDDQEVVVIDAAHEAAPIVDAVGGRRVVALVCTHGHNDHINVAVEVAEATGAPIWLHPDDTMLWEVVNPDRPVDAALADGQHVEVAGGAWQVLHTPGHSPGGCCLYSEGEGVLFSGDTLFNGGPGATGRSFSSKPTILHSIERRLLRLPAGTVVHTGHGDDTTIGAEADGIRQALADLG
ncbi:MBL fold metallo-hydrolase [Aquihabitans sp. McL0605]|uniref:MBL fold metallo-hydrolase n=1 Tax=Aquihabitans sp. McL0605 TaxID=3415671 RepID=UPI003CF4C532